MRNFIKSLLLGAMAFGIFATAHVNSAMATAEDLEEDVENEIEEGSGLVEIKDEPKNVTQVESQTILSEEDKEKQEAAKFPHGLQFGLGLSGTTGINGFVGYNNKKLDSFFAKRFGVRLDFGTMSPLKSTVKSLAADFVGEEGIDINDDLYINNFALDSYHAGLLLDIYPFGDTWFLGGLRLTGGYIFGKTKATADITGSIDGAPGSEFEFELDGHQYKYIGNTVNGKAKVDWSFSGPYLGTGFDLGLFRGFKIYLDAGVVFTSKAAELDFDLNPNNLQVLTGSNPDNPADWDNVTLNSSYLDDFYARKDAELKEANDEFNKYKFYPMAKLGFMYRF